MSSYPSLICSVAFGSVSHAAPRFIGCGLGKTRASRTLREQYPSAEPHIALFICAYCSILVRTCVPLVTAGFVGKLELVREMHGAGISLVSLGQSLPAVAGD